MESALAWLEPRAVVPVVGAGGELPSHGGALYDGLLTPTPTARLVPPDLLGGADARAATLGALLPRGAAVARQTAVWVHTGRLRPERLTVVVAPDRRVLGGGRVHRQQLAQDDVVHLAGVPVTTRTRTAVDLLCFAPPWLAVAGVRLLLGAELSAAAVADALAGRVGLPTRRARALLAEAAGRHASATG